jgi:hypothetical protein
MARFVFIVSLVIAALATPLLAVEDLSQFSGLRDACVAGSLLDASHVPYQVVLLHSQVEDSAGCLYWLNGKELIYTDKGSAHVDPSRLAQIARALEGVSRAQVLDIAHGDRDLPNGCMVFATCAFNQYKKNPHIAWAGLIEARMISVQKYIFSSNETVNIIGHAITAFETDRREVFIQQNGSEPHKVGRMTEQAQRGDKTWCNSLALLCYDHPIQAIADFREQFGRLR